MTEDVRNNLVYQIGGVYFVLLHGTRPGHACLQRVYDARCKLCHDIVYHIMLQKMTMRKAKSRCSMFPLQNICLIHRSVVEIDGYGAFSHARLDFPIRTAQNSLPMPQNSRNLNILGFRFLYQTLKCQFRASSASRWTFKVIPVISATRSVRKRGPNCIWSHLYFFNFFHLIHREIMKKGLIGMKFQGESD